MCIRDRLNLRAGCALGRACAQWKVPATSFQQRRFKHGADRVPSALEFELLDRNQDGVIDKEEFLAAMAHPIRTPTKEQCAQQARAYSEVQSEALLLMAATGDPGARRERMVREVMLVDSLSWGDASLRTTAIKTKISNQGAGLRVAQRVASYALVGAAIASIPLVFHSGTAYYFNELFVHFSPPPANEIETPLEVGAWSWSWMEPPLGTFSFAVLCYQMARPAGRPINPFAEVLKRRRDAWVVDMFPQYSPMILLHFKEAIDGWEGIEAEERHADELKITSSATSAT
eukprot:TRINITY_DN61254_c0_g1_i1.p1 TRINITY_DN61254_c0_g1~~TRINITY_DN61254_c0_g1_i1.p1  ORF type:complete len:288 (+),score=67.63 TRINITY_DN61254_c0_g1_i1:147-1010(+)